MNPVSRARRELIRLTAERAVQLRRDSPISVALANLYCLCEHVAHERGGYILAYWQMAKESLQQFSSLKAAILHAIDKLEDQP
jgi:hypothetical protein